VCWPLPEFKHMQKRGGGGVGGRGRKRKWSTHVCAGITTWTDISGSCIIASLLLVYQCICMFTHGIVHTNIGLRHSHTSLDFSHSH
jgi:hypothetical protein